MFKHEPEETERLAEKAALYIVQAWEHMEADTDQLRCYFAAHAWPDAREGILKSRRELLGGEEVYEASKAYLTTLEKTREG